MTIYVVKHVYYVDGGYGDAIYSEEAVAAFAEKADAEKFVEMYKNEHVYDRPYAELTCGELRVDELSYFTDFASTPKYVWHEDGYMGLATLEAEEAP